MLLLPTDKCCFGAGSKFTIDLKKLAIVTNVIELTKQSLQSFNSRSRTSFSNNRHRDYASFNRRFCSVLFRLCVVPRMPVADDGLIRPLIGFALYLITAVALDGFNKAVSDTHDNARVVCGAVIVAILEEYLVTDFRSFVKASYCFIILESKAASSA